jgi:hypothetical protein
MTDVTRAGGAAKRHFTEGEEEALRRDEATSAIVAKGGGADIRGTDRTWRQTKDEQQGHVGLVSGLALGKDVYEAAELGGALPHAVERLLAQTPMPIALAVGSLGAGTYEWVEAQAKGKEQSAALGRDQAHVALVGALDLPAGYKQQRLEKDFGSIERSNQSAAFKLTERLMADKPGLTTLQLHCDRGMNAARDMARSGMKAEAFLQANPKVADAYAKDAAFHEGFDAYLHTKASAPAADVRAMDQKLDERDGWYSQSQLAIKV